MDETHIARLDDYLDTPDLAAVWFAQPNNFAWLTGGDNVVDAGGQIGVAAAGYDGDTVTVVTDNIEAPRLRDEELPSEVAIETTPWYTSSLADAVADVSPTPAAADFAVPGFDSVSAGALRQPLSEIDIERYRDLGDAVATAVEQACESASPDVSERAVAADVRSRLEMAGTRAPVVLVGSEERARSYRHYTVSDDHLGGYAHVSVTAERHGLHASTTRTVVFDPPAWLHERHDAAARVQTAALGATKTQAGTSQEPAGTANDVFGVIRSAYDAVGWPGEWEHHHQGGAAGYAGREWIATPFCDAPVTTPMAYAWNPTVQGAKSEDTWLVTEDGIECLTTGDWDRRTYHAPNADVALEHTVPNRAD